MIIIITVIAGCGSEAELPGQFFPAGKGDTVYARYDFGRHVALEYQAPGTQHGCGESTEASLRLQTGGCWLLASTNAGDLIARETAGTLAIAAATESTGSDEIASMSFALTGIEVLAGWGLYEIGVIVFGAATALWVYVHRDEMARDVERLFDVANEVVASPRSSAAQKQLATSLADRILVRGQETLHPSEVLRTDWDTVGQRQKDCQALRAQLLADGRARPVFPPDIYKGCTLHATLMVLATWGITPTPFSFAQEVLTLPGCRWDRQYTGTPLRQAEEVLRHYGVSSARFRSVGSHLGLQAATAGGDPALVSVATPDNALSANDVKAHTVVVDRITVSTDGTTYVLGRDSNLPDMFCVPLAVYQTVTVGSFAVTTNLL